MHKKKDNMCVTYHVVQVQCCLLQLIPGPPYYQQDFGEALTRSSTFLILPFFSVLFLCHADAAVQG